MNTREGLLKIIFIFRIRAFFYKNPSKHQDFSEKVPKKRSYYFTQERT